MFRKLITVAFVFTLFTCPVFASDWNGSVSTDWTDPDNWSAGVPVGTVSSDADAGIRYDNVPYTYVCTVGSGVAAVPGRISVRSGDLIINGGTCIAQYQTGRLTIGWYNSAGTPAIVDVTDGIVSGNYAVHIGRNVGNGTVNLYTNGVLKCMRNPVTGTGEVLHLGDGGNERGKINIDGGTCFSELGMTAGSGSGANAQINLDNGLIDIQGNTLFGRSGGTAELNINGGQAQLAGYLHVGVSNDGRGTINIDGGDLTAGECRIGTTGNGTSLANVNLLSGTLKGTTSWFGVGHDGGVGILTVNGGTLDCNDATSVRIGSSFSATQTGTSGTMNLVSGKVSCPEFIVGWRGNGPGVSGTVNVDGGQIDTNDIYIGLGTNGFGTVNMGNGVINASGTLYIGQDGGEGTIYLDGGTIYASELVMNSAIEFGTTDGKLILAGDDVDIVKAYIGQGKIIQIYHPRATVEVKYDSIKDQTEVYVSEPDLTQAYNPNPADGSEIPTLTVTLSWSAGDGVITHDVYFGDNFDDVDAGTGGTYKGNQPAVDTDYGPIQLYNFGETYYWRIDENHSGGTTKGRVWRFSTPSASCIETFDDYADDAALKAVWGSNGALETVEVESGQSMVIAYSGSVKTAQRTITESNWVAGGIKALSVWYKGDPNTVGLSVTLESNNGAQSGTLTDADAVNEIGDVVDVTTGWHEMNFGLSDFGVDLSNVTKIALGVTPVGGQSGQVYFDTICLYPPRPIGPYKTMDFDGDGVVNFGDLSMFAEEWLETNIFPW